MPPGSSRAARPGNRPGDDRDAELGACAHERHEEREKREREDEIDADLLRVGDRRAEQRPRERGQVPGDEQAQLGAEQEPERALLPGDDDSERLVGEEVGRDGAAPAVEPGRCARATARRERDGR